MYTMEINRQIVLDTETTGMNKDEPHYKGHRIIEIGAVEMVNRRLTNRHFHIYLNPDRSIDLEAFNIHGISKEFLNDKPRFSQIANDFLDFIRGSELIIHNASFDVDFIDYEFSMLKNNFEKIVSLCKIIDTLQLARKLFPGKRNNLDALCERYCINNTRRSIHGALLDATLLANVYLSMTGGQISMFFMENTSKFHMNDNMISKQLSYNVFGNVIKSSVSVIFADANEIIEHERYLDLLQKNSGSCIWRRRNCDYVCVAKEIV